jgi:hypothetical protein
MTRLFGFLKDMVPEQTYITKLLQTLERTLLDGGRVAEGEMVGLVATRLSHAENIDTALQTLYGVSGWEAVAVKLMWYVEHIRRESPEGVASEAVFRHHVSEVRALLPITEDQKFPVDQAATAQSTDLREALARFGMALENLRRASFVGGSFSGLPETVLERVIGEAALLQMIASAQRCRDVARFARAFMFFATHVQEHGILQDVRVLQLIGTANLTLQTVLVTLQAEDFDSLYQTIALLESPRTLLQEQ